MINSQVTMAKKFAMKQKSICSIYPRFLHKDFLFQIETLPGVFSRYVMSQWIFVEKYWKVWKYLRKMPVRFYVIRHVMVIFYALAGKLRIQVPSCWISISLVWLEISLRHFTGCSLISKPRSPFNITVKYWKL